MTTPALLPTPDATHDINRRSRFASMMADNPPGTATQGRIPAVAPSSPFMQALTTPTPPTSLEDTLPPPRKSHKAMRLVPIVVAALDAWHAKLPDTERHLGWCSFDLQLACPHAAAMNQTVLRDALLSVGWTGRKEWRNGSPHSRTYWYHPSAPYIQQHAAPLIPALAPPAPRPSLDPAMEAEREARRQAYADEMATLRQQHAAAVATVPKPKHKSAPPTTGLTPVPPPRATKPTMPMERPRHLPLKSLAEYEAEFRTAYPNFLFDVLVFAWNAEGIDPREAAAQCLWHRQRNIEAGL